jgi:hypothetical protein
VTTEENHLISLLNISYIGNTDHSQIRTDSTHRRAIAVAIGFPDREDSHLGAHFGADLAQVAAQDIVVDETSVGRARGESSTGII